MTLINQLIIGEVTIFLLINLTFLIAKKLNIFCIVDVLWGFSFGILATIFLYTGDGYFTRKLILTRFISKKKHSKNKEFIEGDYEDISDDNDKKI